MELNPNHRWINLALANAYLYAGRFPEALAAMQKVQQVEYQQAALGVIGEIYAAMGQPAEARQLLAQVQAGATPDYEAMLRIYIGLGEKDAAFACLEKLYEERSDRMCRLKVDPLFDPLHSDPRFGELVRRVGLPP